MMTGPYQAGHKKDGGSLQHRVCRDSWSALSSSSGWPFLCRDHLLLQQAVALKVVQDWTKDVSQPVMEKKCTN